MREKNLIETRLLKLESDLKDSEERASRVLQDKREDVEVIKKDFDSVLQCAR